jgi:hypothetical protein
MTKQSGSIALLVAVIALATEAVAIDLPKRKSGLWDIKISRASGSRPAQTMQMCIDQNTDNMAQQMGENVAREACSKHEIRREGNKVVGDSVCKIGETTAITRTVFTGEFDRAYHGEVRTKYSPPLMGKSENLTLIDAKWTGPCQADQKPGDMIMPNGMKINIKQMQEQQ